MSSNSLVVARKLDEARSLITREPRLIESPSLEHLGQCYHLDVIERLEGLFQVDHVETRLVRLEMMLHRTPARFGSPNQRAGELPLRLSAP
jgi:hypothetical protein